MYAALGAFVFSPGVTPAEPTSWSEFALWGMIFSMPLVVAGVLADFIQRHVVTPEFLVQGLRNHVVICGYGDHGRQILKHCAPLQKDLSFVVLDNKNGPPGGRTEINGHHVYFIQGDIRDPIHLAAAGVGQASHIVFATGNPMSNLGGAREARELNKHASIYALVDTAHHFSEFIGELGLKKDDLVDQFDAAVSTIAKSLGKSFESTSEPIEVALVGFGRFGKAVLKKVAMTLARHQCHFTVVDRKILPPEELQRWAGLANVPTTVPCDAVEWCDTLTNSSPYHVIIIGLNDDVVGLQCAALARRAQLDAMLVMRAGPNCRLQESNRLQIQDVADLCAAVVAQQVFKNEQQRAQRSGRTP